MKIKWKFLCFAVASVMALSAITLTGCKKKEAQTTDDSGSVAGDTVTEEAGTISDLLDYVRTYAKTFYGARDYLKEDPEYADTTFTMTFESTYTEKVTLEYKENDEDEDTRTGEFEEVEREKTTATYSVKKLNGELALIGVIESNTNGVAHSVNGLTEKIVEDRFESTHKEVYTMMAQKDGDETRYYLFADRTSDGTEGGLMPKVKVSTPKSVYREFEDREEYYDAFAKAISSVQNYYFNNLILYEDLEDFLLGGSYSIIKKGNDLSLNAGINLFIVEDGTPYVTEHMRSFDAKYVNNESVTFTISDKFIEALNNYSMDKKTFVTVKNGTDAQVILNDMDAYVENNSLNIYVFRALGGIPARSYK